MAFGERTRVGVCALSMCRCKVMRRVDDVGGAIGLADWLAGWLAGVSNDNRIKGCGTLVEHSVTTCTTADIRGDSLSDDIALQIDDSLVDFFEVWLSIIGWGGWWWLVSLLVIDTSSVVPHF
jgi:hypothetical protein